MAKTNTDRIEELIRELTVLRVRYEERAERSAADFARLDGVVAALKDEVRDLRLTTEVLRRDAERGEKAADESGRRRWMVVVAFVTAVLSLVVQLAAHFAKR